MDLRFLYCIKEIEELFNGFGIETGHVYNFFFKKKITFTNMIKPCEISPLFFLFKDFQNINY